MKKNKVMCLMMLAASYSVGFSADNGGGIHQEVRYIQRDDLSRGLKEVIGIDKESEQFNAMVKGMKQILGWKEENGVQVMFKGKFGIKRVGEQYEITDKEVEKLKEIWPFAQHYFGKAANQDQGHHTFNVLKFWDGFASAIKEIDQKVAEKINEFGLPNGQLDQLVREANRYITENYTREKKEDYARLIKQQQVLEEGYLGRIVDEAVAEAIIVVSLQKAAAAAQLAAQRAAEEAEEARLEAAAAAAAARRAEAAVPAAEEVAEAGGVADAAAADAAAVVVAEENAPVAPVVGGGVAAGAARRAEAADAAEGAVVEAPVVADAAEEVAEGAPRLAAEGAPRLAAEGAPRLAAEAEAEAPVVGGAGAGAVEGVPQLAADAEEEAEEAEARRAEAARVAAAQRAEAARVAEEARRVAARVAAEKITAAQKQAATASASAASTSRSTFAYKDSYTKEEARKLRYGAIPLTREQLEELRKRTK